MAEYDRDSYPFKHASEEELLALEKAAQNIPELDLAIQRKMEEEKLMKYEEEKRKAAEQEHLHIDTNPRPEQWAVGRDELQSMVNFIDTMTRRGAVYGNELLATGIMRDKLVSRLNPDAQDR